jgi:hypothetical protein
MSGAAPYYTQAYSPLPGRCFCLVSGGEGGGPAHCPEPPVWRGPFRAPNGRRYRPARAPGGCSEAKVDDYLAAYAAERDEP